MSSPTIKSIPVDVFIEKLICNCGKEMIFCNYTYLTLPPKYPHSCECGAKSTQEEKYPKVIYKERDQ
jgi:hypothetical protein